MPTKPKLLILDIETSPNLAHVWSLWNQNVSLSQLQVPGQVIAFAAKWHGKPGVMFYSDHHDGHDVMVQKAWDLLNEADACIHYNGRSFDIPHLQREFVQAGLTPPAPFKQIDLRLAVKKQFRFASNKLDHVSRELGLKGKLSHSGHDLWVRCMAGDDKAWATMKSYNRQDVILTEELYDRLLPWLPNHPHIGLLAGTQDDSCGKCGGTNLEKRGRAFTTLGAYQRYVCRDCGAWSRSGRRYDGVDVRAEA